MFLTAAVVLSMTAAMAEGKNSTAKGFGYNNAYEFNVNTYSLSRTLQADAEQYDKMVYVNEVFSRDMRHAGFSRKAKRQERVNEAITRNLRYMKSILDEAQYKKYLMLLNTTLINRGLR